MAEDKHFDATPTRIARARREGDVPRSSDATAVASFAVALLALAAAASGMRDASARAIVAAAAGTFVPQTYTVLAVGCLCIIVAALAGALFATYAQMRAFVLVAPRIAWKKLDPAAGLRRMFGRDAAIAASRAVVVSSAVVAALLPVVRDAYVAAVSTSDANVLGERTRAALVAVLITALGVGAVFAGFDVLVEREKWRRRLRMSFDELRRDHRQSEGDPHLRGRRRQAHRALTRGAIARVRDAAFVVTNPTHLALALAYDPPRISVPTILVRAAGDAALEARRVAKAFGIPIVENVSLARMLYAETETGDAIPVQAYLAVAEIVAALSRAARTASS